VLRVLKVAKYDEDVASRQKLLRGWQQETLEKAEVLVVGAGALGNEVVKNLIMMGVGTTYVVDFDTVVTSNLNRCVFFRREDAEEGRGKASALAERAMEFSPYNHTRVIPVEANIHEISHNHEIYTRSQVYVSCLDNLEARLELNTAAVHNGKPLVDGGMSGYIGHVQVVIPGQTACLHCDISELELKSMYNRLSCSGSPLEFSGPKIPALPTVTSALGAVMAQEVVKLLLGLDHYVREGRWSNDTGIPLAGKRLYLNMQLNIYGVYSVERNPNCPVCSTISALGFLSRHSR
jgi:molybdopterin/thiamine biosynthesis adenylyltransferase